MSEDHRRAEPVGARPRNVIIGVGILALLGGYSLLGLSNYNFAARLDTIRGQELFLQVMVFLPATLLLVQLIATVFAFLRKRWARITLVVLFAWTILSVVAGTISFFTLRHGTFPGLVEIYLFTWTMVAIRAIGLGLLFTPSANAWFSSRGPER